MKKLTNAIFAMALLFAGASAFAWTDQDCRDVNWEHPDCTGRKPPPPPTPAPVNATGTGTGYGGQANSQAVADATAKAAAEAAAMAANWSSMSSTQRQQMLSSLSAEQKQQLQIALSLGVDVTNKVSNNSPSSSTSTSAGGKSDSSAAGGKSDASATTGPVNAGGGGATVTTNYKYGVPVQLASIQMPSGVHVAGNLQTTVTDCSLRRQDVVMVNEIEARGLGIFKDTSWKNGAVWKLVPTKANVDYSPWEGVGVDDRGNTVEERTAYGQQFKIDSYIVGSAMNNGITIGAGNSSGGSISGGTVGGSNVSTYGNNIVALECQKVFRRTVYAPPPTASTSLILVEEKETVRPTGTTWRVGDACRLPGANCKKVEGTSGERTTTIYASECLKPASPEVALRCAQAKGLLGKPPTVTKEIISPK